MPEPALLAEAANHVLTVTINRPAKKNAVNAEVLCGLSDAWHRLDEDDDLRVCILTGAGGNFCAGMDLSVIAKLTSGAPPEDEFDERMAKDPSIIFDGWLKTYRPSKPLIAAVEGFALAGGTEILQGTDIRVAASDATFGITEAKRGLFPLGGSSVRLRRQIPYTIAAELLLTGRHMSAQEALDFGLVGRLVPPGEALREAKAVAQEICETAPLSIKALMKMLREVDGSYSEADALERELEIGQPVFGTKDAREGPRAFAEKRKAVFTGE
jgi:enoyl-CoA hydratase